MAFSIDIEDDVVRVWSKTGDGARAEYDRSYTPSIYASASDKALNWLHDRLQSDPKVVDIERVQRRISLRDRDGTEVLRASLERPSEIDTLAQEIRTVHEREEWAPGTFRLYNVDLSPKFRYCLETGTDPTPAEKLRTLSISISEKAFAADDVEQLRCDGRSVGESPKGALATVSRLLREVDPDALILSSAQLVPWLHEKADDLGVYLDLGRLPGHTQLAGDSTFQSYGRVGHSPARYDIPGRAIVDRSNSFLMGSGGIPGMVDLVERSHKPLQEVAWGSIGNIFTAIQIREAHSRDMLVPWRAWEAESFKRARVLHDADRGSVTFEPDVGFHEDVVEVDFASLFPNIMRTRNLSPETVRCDCHDTDDVPGLDYSVCEKDGFVGDVLGPIIDDRAEIKRQIAETDDPEETERLEGRSEALKWILVTCFGYQGFNNSKFGRIEVHESINAYGREILLDAKEQLEDGGWRLLHGIVDSLWATPRDDDHDDIEDLCASITDDIGIELEHEDGFEWVAFVPLREGRGGSLTSYFGKVAGRDEFKVRGIEARQRSTPPWIAAVQLDLIETLDEHREPEPVADRLARHLNELRGGSIDPDGLVIKARASKPLEAYEQRTRTVAALERYRDQGIDRSPGQDVKYVVVDDSKANRERVRLHFEEINGYDEGFYADELIRAAESVVSPFGWDRDRIKEYLRDAEDTRLSSWS